jgi:hypothetical protein
MYGSFLGGVVCLIILLPVFLPLLAVSIGKRRESRDAGSRVWAASSQPPTWQSGNQLSGSDCSGDDFGSGGSLGGSGSDGGGGGSSGFN